MKSTVPQLFYARTWLHLGGVIVQPSNHSAHVWVQLYRYFDLPYANRETHTST